MAASLPSVPPLQVNMLAREYCDDCKPKRLKPVILSHAMMPGLLEARWGGETGAQICADGLFTKNAAEHRAEGAALALPGQRAAPPRATPAALPACWASGICCPANTCAPPAPAAVACRRARRR